MPSNDAQETDSLLPTTEPPREQHAGLQLWTLVCVTVTALLIIVTIFMDHSSALDEDNGSWQRENPFFGLSLLGRSDDPVCDDGEYSKRTLKLAYELPFASLFKDTKGQKKYEASSVIVVDGVAYAVCDSSWAISRFDAKLEPFADDNVQVGDPNREKDDSGYESIFHDGNIFYVVRESVDHGKKRDSKGNKIVNKPTGYHAIIEELALIDDDYKVVEKCTAEFEFEGSSKGYEGAVAIRDLKGELVVLGLCEGNHCSEKHKNDRGHGMIVAMRKVVDQKGNCQWATIRKINIPASANFRDYSAMTLQDATGRVAISSQEESQVWVGTLLGRNHAGLWDVNRMEFDPFEGSTYDFPKNHECETIYCNVEGVHWLNDDMLIAVSDKMKGHGKQDFRCFDKDQSVHVFVLP